MSVNDERFIIWGECEQQGIDPEILDYASDKETAWYLVSEYTIAFWDWYIWYEDTEKENSKKRLTLPVF